MTLEKDIRSAMKEKKIMIGSRGVLRAARTGRLSGIVYASNTPRDKLDDINHYSRVSGITSQGYEGNSMQLGELAGKPFSVMLIGITK